ncbi:MAG TPA: DoxX family protein [Polyangia bacterium]|jgi:putative oxidoreductase
MQDSRIETFAARAEPYLYATLRIVAGALFAFHGVQKLFGVHAPFVPAFGSQLWVGAVIELVGGALIALGLFTRPVAFLAAGQMAVAYFQFHWKLALGDGMWLPAVNKGELAVLYCFLFLLVAAHGSGLASLSHLARRSSVRGEETDRDRRFVGPPAR